MLCTIRRFTFLTVLLAAAVPIARAQPILSNYPPTNDTNTTADVDNLRWKALSFSMPASSSATVGNLTVRLGNYSLSTDLPVFEIRDAGGPATDMLIRSPALGAALAKTLGPHSFALMRGHGSVVVATSIKQAVYRAVYAEVNARLQLEATRLGDVTFLNEAEAANADTTNMANLDRPWALWKKRVTTRE